MHFYAAGEFLFEHWQELCGNGTVNHNTFNCIANARSLDFCIFGNTAGHIQICRFIYEQVAHTASCFNYRNTCISNNIFYKLFTTAWKTNAIREWEKSHRKMEIESSGGITIDTLRDYALTGVDFVSVGALTHSYKSLDMSFKAVKAKG